MKILKDWEQVWYAMSNADIAQFQSIKGTTELEFYELLELHEKRLEQIKAGFKH